MSDLKQWAAVNDGLVVHGGFDAPQDLIDHFTERVVDAEGVTTPEWFVPGVTTFVDVTGVDPRPVEGFTKAGNGRWVAPTPPALPSEVQAAFDQRAADDAFILAAAAKVDGGGELTQDERDRLMVLQLARTVITTPPPG